MPFRDLSALEGALREADEWHPIAEALGDPDVRDGLKKVLIGCIHRGELIWAILATRGQASYGHIQCASRTGWIAENMPQMARGSEKFRDPGEWLGGSSEWWAPTHYRHIKP
jgi:hypothetical protein